MLLVVWGGFFIREEVAVRELEVGDHDIEDIIYK